MSTRLVGILVSLVLLVAVGWGVSRRGTKPVVVARPIVKEVVQTLAASGQVAGRDESELGAEVSGRLSKILVREGQQVATQELLARLDDSLLKAQLDQASSALATAESQLLLAQRGPLASEERRVEAESRQGVEVAVAQVENSQRRLDELSKGPTREQIEQARGQFASLQSQAGLAQKEYLRVRSLLSEGAVSQQEMDRVRSSRDSSQQSLYSAQQRLRELELGTRSEVIEQARAQLKQAQANLRAARQVGAAKVEALSDTPRSEDVRVAQGKLQEARQGVKVAQEKLRQAEIRAPYPGLVTAVYLKPGQVVGANTAVLKIVRLPGLELQVDVDESHLGRLKVGQKAGVTSDAYPEQIEAKVREISPAVSNSRGTVRLKLDLLQPPSWLKPGQTVTMNLIFEQAKSYPVVPLTSVTIDGKKSTVFTVESGKLVQKPVQLGAALVDGYPILSGLSEQDQVVVFPAGLVPGQAVRVQ